MVKKANKSLKKIDFDTSLCYSNYMKILPNNTLLKSLKNTIEAIVKDTWGQSVELNFSSCKSQDYDVALNCYAMASLLKENPLAVAEKISEVLVEESEAVKGYVNIKLSNDSYSDFLESVLNKDFFKNEATAKKTMLEYSQPNTHKDLHVGHMRNMVLGKTLSNLYGYFNLNLVTSTFPGDSGTHVAKCLWFMEKFKHTIPEEKKAEFLGKMYVESTKYLTSLKESKETELEESCNKEISSVLSELQKEEGKFFELWVETREYSLDLMKEVYSWCDISFDKWYYESEVDKPSVGYVKELYKENKLIESKGAIGIDLGEKLGFAMFLKKDGNGLYSTKDLYLAKMKFAEGIEESLYLVDERQARHFKQVFKTLQSVGFEEAKNCKHLAYAHVELTTGAMKSRTGNVVSLKDLVNNMEETIETKYSLSKEDSYKIAKGAIFYGMLKNDPMKKIVFDMNEWLKLDGNTGPYLQYAAVRAKSILSKTDISGGHLVLVDAKEKELLLKMSEFNDVVKKSLEDFKLHSLSAYLYNLCKEFNSFYVACPILKEDVPLSVKHSRLLILKGYLEILEKGLELIDVPIPSKM